MSWTADDWAQFADSAPDLDRATPPAEPAAQAPPDPPDPPDPPSAVPAPDRPPADDTAPIPDDLGPPGTPSAVPPAAPPTAPEPGPDAQNLAAAVDALRAALAQNTLAYDHQQGLLDRLHRENEELRAAAEHRSHDPLIRDLITLSDTCLRNGRVWQAKDAALPADVDTALRHISDDIGLILLRNGVDAFHPEPGSPFNRREARAVRSIDTTDPARAGVVAELLSPGFRLGERVLRYAEVVVWRHVQP